MPSINFATHVSAAMGAARNFGSLLLRKEKQDEVLDRARLVKRKLPAIVRGLKQISKSDKSEVLSIGTYLEENARLRPNAPALLFEDRRYTHRQLNEQANRYANLFRSRGVRKGAVVAMFLENRPELLFAVAGAVKLGAIASVINTNQRKSVLVHSFSVCKAELFVVGQELVEAFQEVRSELGQARRESVLFIADSADAAAPSDMSDAAPLLAEAATSTPAELRAVTLGDPCFYIYTSGTTGLPKASIMSHFRWVKAAGAFGTIALDMKPTDVMYVALPLYHNNALSVAWGSAACAGACLVIRRKFSASKFWEDVRRYRANCFCYIGELCRYLMNQPRRPDDAHNPVQKIIGNGLRPDIWNDFKERFDIAEVYEFYAASEGNIAFVNVLNLDKTIGFCPAPYAIVEYDIDRDQPVRGADGFLTRVKRGGTGLLIGEVSEKYAFDGYTDPVASEKKLLRDVFEPGDVWFNSGDLLKDLGFRHAQFVDRIGDTFRWKSENVSTNEVAEVVNSFEQVDESTVYGVQIPGTEGRAGMAAVVANVPVDNLDITALSRHLTSELPVYARPVFLRFRPALEVTGTFKQKKSELRTEGFDPAAVTEPLYVLLPGTDRYTKLTDDVFRRIQGGQMRF